MKICILCGDDLIDRFAVGYDGNRNLCDLEHRLCKACADKIIEYSEINPKERNGHAIGPEQLSQDEYIPYCPYPGCLRQLLGFKLFRVEMLDKAEDPKSPTKITDQEARVIDSQGRCPKCLDEVADVFAVPCNSHGNKCHPEHKYCVECIKLVVREVLLECLEDDLVCLKCQQLFVKFVVGHDEVPIQFDYANGEGTAVVFRDPEGNAV